MFITQFPTLTDDADSLLKTTDRALSALQLPIGPTDTSFDLIDASKFPLGAQLVTVESEIIAVSSRTGNTFTVFQRGYNGTVASGHASGTKASLNFTSHHWNNLIDAVLAIEAFVTGSSIQTPTAVPSGNTVTIKSVPIAGFTDADWKIRAVDSVTGDIIKMNLRVVAVSGVPMDSVYGKLGSVPDTDYNILLSVGGPNLVIQWQNLRPNSMDVLIGADV